MYLVLAGLWAYMAQVIVKNDNNNSSLVYGAVVFAIIGLLHLCLELLHLHAHAAEFQCERSPVNGHAVERTETPSVHTNRSYRYGD